MVCGGGWGWEGVGGRGNNRGKEKGQEPNQLSTSNCVCVGAWGRGRVGEYVQTVLWGLGVQRTQIRDNKPVGWGQ